MWNAQSWLFLEVFRHMIQCWQIAAIKRKSAEFWAKLDKGKHNTERDQALNSHWSVSHGTAVKSSIGGGRQQSEQIFRNRSCNVQYPQSVFYKTLILILNWRHFQAEAEIQSCTEGCGFTWHSGPVMSPGCSSSLDTNVAPDKTAVTATGVNFVYYNFNFFFEGHIF